MVCFAQMTENTPFPMQIQTTFTFSNSRRAYFDNLSCFHSTLYFMIVVFYTVCEL